MADNSFFARTKELEKMVGDGDLVGTFSVDGGARTTPLELGFWQSGPLEGVHIQNWTTGGTGPHAAQNSFEAVYEMSLEDIAKTTLESGPQDAMARHVENVNDEFQKRAPKDTGQYRDSTGRVVTDRGVPIHERFGEHYGEEPSAT